MDIKEMFEPRCIHRHTAKTHPHCFDKSGSPIKSAIPGSAKVLVFDIETLPILARVWGVWNQDIHRKQIVKDWCVLSWSAKWLGDDRIISDILSPREALSRNDKRLVSSFWKLLDSADVVIAHNGKKFDIKKINSRLWKHGLPKPSSYKVIDTLSVVKSVFGQTYNSLDAIAEYIGAQEKLETDFDLWTACDEGKSEALKYMLEYNENDIRGLEEVYLSMREWVPNHPDLRIYSQSQIDENCCPVCLSTERTDLNFYVANSKKYPEHRCNTCGTVWHDSKSIKEQV